MTSDSLESSKLDAGRASEVIAHTRVEAWEVRNGQILHIFLHLPLKVKST